MRELDIPALRDACEDVILARRPDATERLIALADGRADQRHEHEPEEPCENARHGPDRGTDDSLPARPGPLG